MDVDLLCKFPLAQSGVPEATDQLIDLGLIAPSTRALVVMHPSSSLASDRIGNHGVHRTPTMRLYRARIGRRVGKVIISHIIGTCCAVIRQKWRFFTVFIGLVARQGESSGDEVEHSSHVFHRSVPAGLLLYGRKQANEPSMKAIVSSRVQLAKIPSNCASIILAARAIVSSNFPV
jgi:hypothetical protein